MSIFINKQIEQRVRLKALEMVDLGISTDSLGGQSDEPFNEFQIQLSTIETEPENTFLSFTFEDQKLAGKIVSILGPED